MAGIRDWIMGDMPLKPEHTKEAKITKHQLPTGTRRDIESTKRSAPDIIAQAWGVGHGRAAPKAWKSDSLEYSCCT